MNKAVDGEDAEMRGSKAWLLSLHLYCTASERPISKGQHSPLVLDQSEDNRLSPTVYDIADIWCTVFGKSK